jgi:hypothetical protein
LLACAIDLSFGEIFALRRIASNHQLPHIHALRNSSASTMQKNTRQQATYGAGSADGGNLFVRNERCVTE